MVRVVREIGGRKLEIETGRIAKLADGAVVVRYGDTMVFASAQAATIEKEDLDFFPLTVDYREKAAAAGKFPGGFFKREGRPTTREILTCRIIDRAIRPLFPSGFKKETQVLVQVLSTDKENDSDVAAAVAAFAAIAISSIPHGKTLGACRIGLIDGKLRINPTWTELRSKDNQLNLTIAAHADAVVMVEAGANQVEESVMLEALELGHEVCQEIAGMIDELVAAAGKPKSAFSPPVRDEKLVASIEKRFGKELMHAPVSDGDKQARSAAKSAVKQKVSEAFPAPADADDKAAQKHRKLVAQVCEDLFDKGERESILDGRRADGRGTTDIRQLTIDVGVLPRVHGSSLFTRGETQALCIATLGTVDDQQTIDGIYPEEKRRWLLHYNFPPFSVGEVRRFGAPGRREIGHGALAERALEAILPASDQFAYSVRVTSEIMESNGSSSMATVCGATLALMDAGVPIKQPVAGIAMGLVVEGKRVAILSDILGSEDHCGDMDFKVAGTGRGITALQMDIKCEGLARETMQQALEQAKEGRMHILREMLNVIRRPREAVSEYAPRLVSFPIPLDKIGAIIGPGGRTIRGMQDEFEVRIAVQDTGVIEVCGLDARKVDACIARIKDMTAEVELGKVYKGRVTGLKEFGAFVEILPGQEGLVHVSELSDGFVRSVADVVAIGDVIEVKVIDIDDFGKVKLSRKALLQKGAAPAEPRGDALGVAPRSGEAGTDTDFDGGPPRDPRPRRDRDERRPDRGERRERPERSDRGDRPERVERSERPERSDRGDRPERVERSERPESTDRVERPARFERGESPERSVRPDRPERFDRPERLDRPERSERPERFERPERVERTERPERADRPDRVERPERFDRPERVERPERFERPESPARPDRGERPPERREREPRTDRSDPLDRRPRRETEWSDRPERAERIGSPEGAERTERPERPERGERFDRTDRPVRTDRPDRPERTERTDRPARAPDDERLGRGARPEREITEPVARGPAGFEDDDEPVTDRRTEIGPRPEPRGAVREDRVDGERGMRRPFDRGTPADDRGDDRTRGRRRRR